MRYTLISLIAVLLSACKYLGFDVQEGFEQSSGWTSSMPGVIPPKAASMIFGVLAAGC